MKKSISLIASELGLASVLEIELVLKELTGTVKKRTLFSNLKKMEAGRVLFKVLSSENSYEIEGYMPGPSIEAEDDFEIKRIIVERGLSARDVQEVDWGLFSSRVLRGLVDELEVLRDDLEKTYDDPKSGELRYFDLSIKYHELYGFFFDYYKTGFLAPADVLLSDCRNIINKKDI